MVTTRRKSTVTHKKSSDDAMGVDGFVDHYGASSSASKKSRKRDDLKYDSHDDETPQKKKTKTSKTAHRKGKVTARSLMKDLFATLPLELIYEIFERLHPLDLLHIARTSKLIRSHLISKRSITVWKTAREAVIPPVPDCPKDQSEPQWAMLLFTHDCTMCGTPRMKNVDWNLRLRGCETCFKSNLSYSPTAKKTYPNVKDLDTIMELLPWTKTGSWAHAHSSGMKLYHSEQIAKMAKIVEGFHVRIDAGVKGARAEFENFIEKKKAEAAEQVESGKELKEWAMNGAKMRDVTEYQLKQQRKEAMISKLAALGHDPRDVRQAADRWRSHPNIFDSMRQLSDSIWRCVKSKAEMFVETEKQLRLDIEQKSTRDARRDVAKTRYAKFKETYDSSPDMFMPTEFTFVDLPAIKSVVQSDGYDVSPSIFDDIFDELPAIINEWRSERRVDLARILLESRCPPGDVKPDPIAAEKEGILFLATSLFSSCTEWNRNGPVEEDIYWMDNVHKHFSDASRRHPPFRKSTLVSQHRCIRAIPEFSEKAKQVVQAAGLNPATATSLDMDALDARFWCKDCPAVGSGSQAVARNWRNCVTHLGFHVSSWKGWEVLADKDRATIAAKENAASTLEAIDWDRVAMSLQGRAVDLRGFDFKLKIGALKPLSPQAVPSNSNASGTPGE